MLFAGCAGALVADDASADSVHAGNAVLSEDKVMTGGKFTATLTYNEADKDNFRNVSYTAKVVDSKGATQSNAVSKTYGTSTDLSMSEEITITAPDKAGKYTLVVEFTEMYNQTDGKDLTLQTHVEKSFNVYNPVVLSVTVNNNGTLKINDAVVYFYVDGAKIEDSKTTLTVDVGSEKTLTYKYFDKNMSAGKHTYTVQPAEHAYMINGLGDTHTFYYKQSGQDYMVWIMALIFLVVLFVAVWIFRKPVKNYGKPKARR